MVHIHLFFSLRDCSFPSTSNCSSRKPNQEMEKLKCHPIVRKRNRENEPESESGKGRLASVTWPAKNLILPVPKAQEPRCTLTPHWLVLSLTSSPTGCLSSSASAPGPPDSQRTQGWEEGCGSGYSRARLHLDGAHLLQQAFRQIGALGCELAPLALEVLHFVHDHLEAQPPEHRIGAGLPIPARVLPRRALEAGTTPCSNSSAWNRPEASSAAGLPCPLVATEGNASSSVQSSHSVVSDSLRPLNGFMKTYKTF